MRNVSTPLTVLVVPLIALLLALSACSGDDEPDQPAGTSGSTDSGSDRLATTTRVAEITGKLPKKKRQQVVDGVTQAVDRWWDAAYLAVDADDPFPGFTAGAARLAQRDADIMTNASFVDGAATLEATRRVVTVDVVAARQRAVGVGAKVLLVVETAGDRPRRITVRGTVQLSRDKGGWQIFGYRMTATPKGIS